MSRGVLSIWRRIAGRLQMPADGKWLAVAVCSCVALVSGIAAAMYFDPEKAVWFPKCPVHWLTGFKCPGCGTARALHALARGEWRAAFHFNAMIFVALPLLALIVAMPKWARHPCVAWGVLVAVIAWTVLRNTIGGL